MEFEPPTESKSTVNAQDVLSHLFTVEDNVNKRLNHVEDACLNLSNYVTRSSKKAGTQSDKKESDGAVFASGMVFGYFLGFGTYLPLHYVANKPAMITFSSAMVWFVGVFMARKIKNTVVGFVYKDGSFILDVLFWGLVVKALDFDYADLLQKYIQRV